MQSSVVKRLVLLCAVLALPAMVFAQEAVLTGTITDSSGGVLPGVTVQATHEASGNQFETVTEGSGVYRIPARVGTYRITAQLAGFTTVTRDGVQVLVGQTLNLNMQMAPSTIQETVTVTGEAPLISTTTSSLGGNTTRGRCRSFLGGTNWMQLALRRRAAAPSTTAMRRAGQNTGEAREFQRTWMVADFVRARHRQQRNSADSIANSSPNRFDATQACSPA